MTTSPAAALPPRPPVLRIGDAERMRTAVALQDAAAAGRLTLDELDERLAVAAAARTAPELAALVMDLPATAVPTDRRPRVHRVAAVVLAVLLVWTLTSVLWVRTGVPVGWPLWVVLLLVLRRSLRVGRGSG